MKIRVIISSEKEKEIMLGAKEITDIMGFDIDYTDIGGSSFEDLKNEILEWEKDTEIYIVTAAENLELPKLIAQNTKRPVIAVPIKTEKYKSLELLESVVNMGSEGPYCTVAINGAANSALLACQMIGTKDEKMYERLEEYREELKNMVAEKERLLLEKISAV